MSVDLSVSEHIATVTLNRPEKLNAVDMDTQRALSDAWRKVRQDSEIWVAVLTGAGTRAFSAGFDLKEMSSRAANPAQHPEPDPFWNQDGSGAIETDLNIRKPVIAAIEGYCLGIGLTLALSCDIRIASDRSQFGYPEARWGVPAVAGALRLPQVTSLGLAMEMLLVGDFVNAQRAYQVGLINRVVPEGKALEAAQEVAWRICQNAPLTVQATKEIIVRGLTLPFNDAWRLGEALRRSIRQTEDFSEGMASFREKRPANFRGR